MFKFSSILLSWKQKNQKFQDAPPHCIRSLRRISSFGRAPVSLSELSNPPLRSLLFRAESGHNPQIILPATMFLPECQRNPQRGEIKTDEAPGLATTNRAASLTLFVQRKTLLNTKSSVFSRRCYEQAKSNFHLASESEIDIYSFTNLNRAFGCPSFSR